MFKLRALLLMMTITFLISCAGQKIQQARNIKVTGTEFQQSLYHEYLEQADKEQQSGDAYDTDFYATRAIKAGSGNRVQPYAIDESGLPTESVPAMREARKRLVKSLDSGARKLAPKRTARAQATFDCWVEETQDNHESQRAHICKERFNKNITEVEQILKKEDLLE